MHLSLRHALLSTFAVVLVAGTSGSAWYVSRRVVATPDLVEDGIPLPPPASPRLTDDPEYGQCLSGLAENAQSALAFAETWNSQGGGDGAKHCAALAQLALGEPEQAASRLEMLGAQSVAGSEARAAIYGQAAQAWITAGKPNRAHDAITLALALAPTNPDLLVDHAVVAGRLNRWAEALADVTRATSSDAGRPEAWVFRAAALRRLDRTQEAMRDVERALSLSPDNPEGLLERGILRQISGDLGGAQRDWERVIELAPDSAAADLAQQNLALSEAGPFRR